MRSDKAVSSAKWRAEEVGEGKTFPQRLKPNSLQSNTYGLKAVPFKNSLQLRRVKFFRGL
jgi:hypothetical protein